MNSNENMVIDEKLLTDNAEFLKAVIGAKTVEEAQSICKEFNIVLPDDMWQNIKNSYRDGKLVTTELSENELSDVAGGFSGDHLLNAIAGVVGLGAVVAAGSAAGCVVACAWIGYHAYKTFR